MAWLQASVTVSGSDIDTAVACFELLGALSITQQNAGEDDYFDLAHPAKPGWQRQQVVGLFDEAESSDRIRAAFADVLPDLPVHDETLADQDWERVWLDRYQPIHINERLAIYPSWQEPDADAAVILKIDPGLAFGTGMHPTTALCLDQISQLDWQGKRVLDMGCGSGILGIAALKFGAEQVTGVDIDPKAEQVAAENAALNGVASGFEIQSAAQLADQTFDVVIANILAGALIDMADEIQGYLKPEGLLILSGVLAKQAKAVCDAYPAASPLSTVQQGDWVVITGSKHASELSSMQ